MTAGIARIGCCLLLVLAALAPQAVAAATTAEGQREIEMLIARLGTSKCAFERNGRWYDGRKAQQHLRRKHDYMRKRGLADTAEHFIERGASRSSLSGKPYRVRCPGQPAEESGAWFRAMLQRLRSAPEAAPTR